MDKRIYELQLVFVFTCFWLILFESASLMIVLSGIVISKFSILITEKFFLNGTFYELYPFNLFKIARYTIYLLGEIYKSGLSIIPTIISGKANPDIVEIQTDLESNIGLVILANSITLTPGTITVDLQGHRIQVLWLDPKTKQPTMAGKYIKGSIEKRLKEYL